MNLGKSADEARLKTLFFGLGMVAGTILWFATLERPTTAYLHEYQWLQLGKYLAQTTLWLDEDERPLCSCRALERPKP